MYSTDLYNENIHNTLFVSNNFDSKTTVLKELQKELLSCDEFSLSVAFITLQGLTMILEQLKMLEEAGIKGRIITSTYQMFNSPDVYDRLLKFKHIDVKIYSEEIHHTKGYIFDKEDRKTVMIGSSNLTGGALKVNREWNLKVENAESIEMTQKLLREFEEMWEKSEHLTEDWIIEYTKQYEKAQALKVQLEKIEPKEKQVIPNKMQTEALRNLEYLRYKNQRKALLISATGTGKTYLAAFDVRNFNPRRALFVIHREQIARDALRTFKKVMPDKTMGLLSGTQKDLDADILFTTIQSISRDHNLHHFSKDHFDYIVFDEAHRTGADSYIKTLNYFTPEFTLGMTATPERTDGYNVFEHFDYNIAYEIRLQGALQENMLAPFHYFGVTDVTVDGETLDESSSISKLVSKHRVDKIVENIHFYGYSGDKLKGLMFCSRNEEAKQLSEALNQLGLNTLALSGDNTQEEREEAIENLMNDKHPLQYILTVDIFNEGIDIPHINQIVMLRPTQSAIIFVQQLGRGLRKAPNKEFVVVIDFIGNYKNNFMIPIALSGDRSYSQNNLRKYVMSGSNEVPGTSTIEFDKISKERIYESINQGRFNQRVFLRKEYENLKFKLGRIPKLSDFLKYDSLDPQVFLHQKAFDNYHKFLSIMDSFYNKELNETENQILSFISREFSNGKREIELYILENILNHDLNLNELNQHFGRSNVQSALRYFSLNFLIVTERKKYNKVRLFDINDDYLVMSSELKKSLQNKVFKMHYLDLIDYSKKHHDKYYSHSDEFNMVLYEQYSRQDVCWLLNWESDQKGQIFGYKIDHATKTIPLFVTYQKASEISESIQYQDYFINRETVHWQSRNNRTIQSPEIESIINANENDYNILLFVKRNDGEDKHFYYLGELDVLNYEQSTMLSNGKELDVVNFVFKLKNPVRDDLYTYITED